MSQITYCDYCEANVRPYDDVGNIYIDEDGRSYTPHTPTCPNCGAELGPTTWVPEDDEDDGG